MPDKSSYMAEQIQHITPDEVPDVMRTLNVRDSFARIVSENSAADAAVILDTSEEIIAAIVAYVKPRWPELF